MNQRDYQITLLGCYFLNSYSKPSCSVMLPWFIYRYPAYWKKMLFKGPNTVVFTYSLLSLCNISSPFRGK